MTTKKNIGIVFAFLAAMLYAFNFPFSKILLQRLSPTMMAGILYLGAGAGMVVIGFFRKKLSRISEEPQLTQKDIPFIIAIILLDIIAPIFLMIGIQFSTASSVSLLVSFEIVATALIAKALFRESISRQLWFAIALITFSSLILSFDSIQSFSFSIGSILVLSACTCWGFENNCTRKLSNKDPLQIVAIKGVGSGFGSLFFSVCRNEFGGSVTDILWALLLGFITFGLSIFFYVYAQRFLGAAKTSAYYAIAPFFGVILSFLIFRDSLTNRFLIALIIMIAGVFFVTADQRGKSVV